MKRKDGLLARGPDWAILGQRGTVVGGPPGGGTAWWGEEIQHRKLAGLCGVAGWVVESGEARLQSLAGGEEI